MGRKNKTKGTSTVVELDPEVASKVETKQKQGDEFAESKKFGEALSAYDEALKELPERHSLIADLHGSKATVFLADKKYKEAIKECNQGLAVEGTNSRVLDRRARARYEMGFFKDALNDIQKVNATGDRTDESAAFEAQCKTALNGNKSSAGEATAVAATKATKPTYSKEQTANLLRQSNNQFACKVTLDSETKYLHIPYGISYHQLLSSIREKWTGLVNFKVFYQDKESDWVLVTSGKDVAKAQSEILAYAQRVVSQRQRQGLDAQPPTCRFKLEKCKRADVPAVPREEVPKGEERSKVVVKSTDPQAEETVVELDDWLIDFANLFRDQLGIDPDKHVDVHTEGAEACSKALDTAVKLPEAKELFAESFERFRDVTCIGLCNWANVHLCLAKKLMEHAAENGQTVKDVKKQFEEHCNSAIKRYNEALSYNGQYVEAMLGIGQVHIEQARLEAGILIPALDNVDSEAYKEMNQEEIEEVTKAQGRDANAKLRIALKKVSVGDVKKTSNTWKKVYDQFAKAEKAAAGEKSAKTMEREALRADAIVSPPNPDETHLMKNQVKIIWGNALYDQSQIWAGVGLDGWKAMVSDAKARFLDATCKESDVTEALRNHIQAEDLDLPIEEKKPAAAPVVAAASAALEKKLAEKKDAPKGLPALKKKKATK